jgi:beta-glucanase (GH16 family)
LGPALIAAALGLALLARTAEAGEPTLIWSDEFDGEALDPAKWSAAHDCWGGGNGERQCYTPGGVEVSGGLLRLTARAERAVGPASPQGGRQRTRAYSSGKVLTRGVASFRYGRIEVRAKLPEGQGLWPAIWMLPEHDNYGPYPQSGEIDIAEAVNLGANCTLCAGGEERRVHASLHHGPSLERNVQRSGARALPDSADGFHLFALNWTPAAMTWTVDGERILEARTRAPFDQRFHLILNLAVGGRWAEGQNAGGVRLDAFPAQMLVDWVRVYEAR